MVEDNLKSVFYIKQNIWQKMIHHCSSQLPLEACGLLTGSKGKAETIWEMENILKSPNEFEMSDEQLEVVFHSFEQGGEELVGIYHSHPTAPPYPSIIDIANANYPDVIYLIVSFANRIPEVGCFWIRNHQVIPVLYRLF